MGPGPSLSFPGKSPKPSLCSSPVIWEQGKCFVLVTTDNYRCDETHVLQNTLQPWLLVTAPAEVSNSPESNTPHARAKGLCQAPPSPSLLLVFASAGKKIDSRVPGCVLSPV